MIIGNNNALGNRKQRGYGGLHPPNILQKNIKNVILNLCKFNLFKKKTWLKKYKFIFFFIFIQYNIMFHKANTESERQKNIWWILFKS
jgi:hypothetical protein